MPPIGTSDARCDRRSLLGGAAAAIATLAVPGWSAQPTASRLVLLGTGGGPVLGGERGMAANVILVGEAAYVIDCGYGACAALARAKVPLRRIEGIFITHEHADHMLDLGPLLFFCWLQGRTGPIELYGPPPLQDIARSLLAANAVPLRYYQEDMHTPPMPRVDVHEIAGPQPVMQDSNVHVTSAVVHHPPVMPALAYRFDMPDRAIVFSGDTSPSEALIRLAKGADMLVHEATQVDQTLRLMSGTAKAAGGINGAGGSAPQGYDAARFREHVLSAHTSVEDAGRVATAAGVGTLVLNHLSPGSSAIVPDAEWIARARSHFAGRIVVGHDGMVL